MPNAETIQAFREAEQIKRNPNLGKTYSDVDEMMEDLLKDV